VDLAEGVIRAGLALLLCAMLPACDELPLPPEVEPGGEPGAPVYSAA
jgi:hypothetical protein